MTKTPTPPDVTDPVERQWRNDFTSLANAIPTSWIVTDEDGLMWITTDHRDDPRAKLYHNHCIVGYAKGWL